MKYNLFSIISLCLSIVLGSATTANNFFECQWFVFDGQQGTGDHNDIPVYSEAVDPLNYRPLYVHESPLTLCPGTNLLCAICANPTSFAIYGKIRPKLNYFEDIRFIIDSYYGQINGIPAQDPTILDYPSYIREHILNEEE